MALYSVGVAHVIEVETVHGGVEACLVLPHLALDSHLVAHDTEDDSYDGDQHQSRTQHQRQDTYNKKC